MNINRKNFHSRNFGHFGGWGRIRILHKLPGYGDRGILKTMELFHILLTSED